MKLNLKSVVTFIMVVAMIAMISGCGTSSAPNTVSTSNSTVKVEETKKEVKTFSMVMFTEWYKAGWAAIESDINSKPELGFKLDIQKIGGEVIQITQTRFASGELPDFLNWYSAQDALNNLHGDVNFVDISDPSWTKNYDMDMLKSRQYSINGKIVGLPSDGTSLGGMLYNKKVFSELNLQVPNNWTEFLAVCDKIKAAGKVPVYYSGKDAWSMQILPIEGFSREFKAKGMNQLMDDINTNRAKYVDQKLFIDSIAKLKELKDKDYINKDYLSDTYDDAQKALAEGSAGMYCMATWVLDEINKKYPDKINDIGAFPVPFDGNDTVAAWMPGCLMMTIGCKDGELGKKIVNYIGSHEVQTLFFAAQPSIPAAKGIEVQLYPAAQELYKVFNTDGRGGPIFQHLYIYEPGLSGYLADLMVGSKTPEQVVQTMDSETAKNAKNKGASGW